LIDPAKWNAKDGLPYNKSLKDVDYKNLKTDLDKLRTKIETELNVATNNKEEINQQWLQDNMDSYFGRVKKTEKDRFVNVIKAYIDYLTRKIQNNRKGGAEVGTNKRYKVLKSKIEKFEKQRKKKVYVKEVGRTKFIEELETFLFDVDRLNINYVGRLMKRLKKVCTWITLTDKSIQAYPQLSQIQGYTAEAEKVF